MEIGPIAGVRAGSLLSVQRAESAQPPVFLIDPSARPGDETYSSARQAPNRGLEDEDSVEPGEEEFDLAAPPTPARRAGGISYFA
jgi:hypothetical protein